MCRFDVHLAVLSYGHSVVVLFDVFNVCRILCLVFVSLPALLLCVFWWWLMSVVACCCFLLVTKRFLWEAMSFVVQSKSAREEEIPSAQAKS